jgi:Zn-dependent protease with chaperone function
MAITYRDRQFTGFQEYIQTARRAPADTDSTPLYAHPIDGWIVRTLNATPIKNTMSKAVDLLISLNFGHMLANSISIDQHSFPDLFEILAHCSSTLGIAMPHAVARQSPDLFNAATAGTDEYHFISITAGLCEMYTPQEATFVIGHECGHIAAGHVLYNTVVVLMTYSIAPALGPIGQILMRTAWVPLRAWSRRAEITCDRAGLLCCGDIAIAERALLRLVAGFADVDRIDIEDFLRRARATEDFHSLGMLQEWNATHPLIARRIEALRLFADSELYYDLSGKPRPTDRRLLPRQELDDRINELIQP